jgi:aryl-alcohol dehydrogenase-like predicted oxidoreductase
VTAERGEVVPPVTTTRGEALLTLRRPGPDAGRRQLAPDIMRAIDASLWRLQTDHVDLYQLHF